MASDATQIWRLRGALGEAGVEELLKTTTDTAVRIKVIKASEFERVIVDATGQAKAIARPVESLLTGIACHKVVGAPGAGRIRVVANLHQGR